MGKQARQLTSGVPSDLQAELAVLGTLLLENDAYFDAIGDLSSEDFSLDSNKRIFGAIASIMEGMEEGVHHADPVTLQHVLRKRGELSTVGGAAYISDLTTGIPRKLNIEEHVKIIREKAKLRLLMDLGKGLYQGAEGQVISSSSLIENLQERLMRTVADDNSEATHVGDIVGEVEASVLAKRNQSLDKNALDLTWGIDEMDFFTKGLFGGELTILGAESGAGKLMDINEPIPTPRGFILNGDLKDGDEIFGDDGMVYSVLKAHPIQEEESFKVTFDDGTFTYVHAGHLWHTWTFKDRQKKFKQSDEFRAAQRAKKPKRGKGLSPWTSKRNSAMVAKYVPPPVNGSVKNTAEIMTTLSVNNCERANHSIRLSLPVQLPRRRLRIDPYMLGAWLGDGLSASAGIIISKDDASAMRMNLAEVGYDTVPRKDPIFWGVSRLQKDLRGMGLLNNKHIPQEYLWASAEQRLELLRGLMDTDGYCADDGNVEFCNTNRDLAMGVYQLASSLGVKPTFKEGRATLYGKDCGPKYRVSWTAQLECFKLRRKAVRLPKKLRETQRWRYIIGVEPAGKRMMRCLTTSNPNGLYLFGRNFNVTHNTAMMLQIVLENALLGIPCFIASMEMKKEKLVQRMYPQLSKIIMSKHIRDPRLINAHTDVPEIQRLSKFIAGLPIWIDDTSPMTLQKLKARAKIQIRRHKIRMFAGDYFQLINVPGAIGVEKIEQVAFGMRDFAKSEPDVHTLLLSQYSKASGFMKKQRRTKSDLMGGSAIHHAAQNVVLITVESAAKRDPDDLLDAEFTIDKQRDGATGRVNCCYDRKRLRFVPSTQQEKRNGDSGNAESGKDRAAGS